MAWITKQPKLIIGLLLLLIAAYFVVRLRFAYLHIHTFLLGMVCGLSIGIIPYVRYRWFRKKKADSEDI